ncbi:hypothetical protein Bca101_082892 [Brassica carinata]
MLDSRISLGYWFTTHRLLGLTLCYELTLVCVLNPKVTKRTKSQKGKDAAGASGQVEQDGAVQTAVLPAGTIPTTVLPSQVGLGNNEPGLPVDPITEVRVTAEDDQQEQVQEDDAGSSNAGNDSGQNIGANNVRVAGAGVGVEPSMRDILEAMQLMGAQMVSLNQAFTPLVNS